MSRRARGILIVCLGMSALLTACSETGRYRVMRFFFDGVPPPGAIPVRGYPAPAESFPLDDTSEGPPKPKPKLVYYPHEPYRENRCASCHAPDDGQLFKSAEDGLCQTCHAELTSQWTYLHGPAAVNACLFCHHYHSSIYPKMLLGEENVICLRCHQVEDLTAGSHHATLEDRPCSECHDPHGGHDRFFLKPGEN